MKIKTAGLPNRVLGSCHISVGVSFTCENAMSFKAYSQIISISLLAFLLIACGGGSNTSAPASPPVVDNNEPQPTTPSDIIYQDPKQVARFLSQATFGATQNDISQLTDKGLSTWYQQQLKHEPSYLLPVLSEMTALSTADDEITRLELEATTIGFWRHAIKGNDQLRQRVAFALSQILVVSNGGGNVLTDVPSAVAYYQDLLIKHAFGNYRDLLEDVTYSPAMGQYLTYRGSKKGNPKTGRMPDENYARELLQLFTLGVIALNPDGTPRLDANQQQIETYSNADITGLARVFTGLNIDKTLNEQSRSAAFSAPMTTNERSHSSLEKNFLNQSIDANTNANESIKQALDIIFAHPNIAPFISTQLIQRLVTSNPSPAYVTRVSKAFESGIFQLPNGDNVGDSRRGDLSATIAAILFDNEARNEQGNKDGKIREPIIRFAHWARAFNVHHVTAEFQRILWDTTGPSSLMQHPYRAPSVFNFYRPGYIAPGTLTGAQGLKAPELQITNASSVAGYSNFMTHFIFLNNEQFDIEEINQFFAKKKININTSQALESFVANYQREITLLDDPQALLSHLDVLLTHGKLSNSTKQHIIDVLTPLNKSSEQEKRYQVQIAILMIMTSPDYLIQQ